MSPSLIWFCVGLACLASEIFVPHIVLVFFGAGALTSALFSLVVHDTVTELVIFSVVSVASLLFLRGKVLKMLWGRSKTAGESDASPGGQPGQSGQDGRTGTVSRAIPAEGEGEISLGGSYWRATAAEPLPEGTAIRVVSHAPDNEILLQVERLRTK